MKETPKKPRRPMSKRAFFRAHNRKVYAVRRRAFEQSFAAKGREAIARADYLTTPQTEE
jgi:hypothetical protein